MDTAPLCCRKNQKQKTAVEFEKVGCIMKSLLAFTAIVFTFMVITNHAIDVFVDLLNNSLLAMLAVLLICAIGVIAGRAIDEKVNY